MIVANYLRNQSNEMRSCSGEAASIDSSPCLVYLCYGLEVSIIFLPIGEEGLGLGLRQLGLSSTIDGAGW